MTTITQKPEHQARTVQTTGTGHLFALVILSYPIGWAVGLAPVFPLLLTIPMMLWLIRNQPVVVPQGTILFGLFLLFVAGSAIQVNSAGRLALFGMRSSWYFSAFIAMLYLYANLVGRDAERTKIVIVRAFIFLWVSIVACGYLALIAPNLSWTTPTTKVLPGFIAENSFIVDLVTPRTAEVQTFASGVVLNRPAAPFPYTNTWGSSFALLGPFVALAWMDKRIGFKRWVLVVLIALSTVPFYYALNRGAWLTLGIGLIYGCSRYSVIQRSLRPMLALLAAGVLALVLASSTGVFDTAISQLDTRAEDSNETRGNLYVETVRASVESPLIGHGTPLPNPSHPNGPPLGTHGQLWAVLFAHGFIAAGLFLLFFIQAFVSSRAQDSIAHWAKASVLIGLLQMPVYGHLPYQLFILMGSVTLAMGSSASQKSATKVPQRVQRGLARLASGDSKAGHQPDPTP